MNTESKSCNAQSWAAFDSPGRNGPEDLRPDGTGGGSHGHVIRTHEPEYALQEGPPLKRLELRLSVQEGDLEMAIKRAFDLAKSAGHELDLTFSYGTA